LNRHPEGGPNGLLLVDKPEGLTSHDVVDEARRLLGTRRIGHTGTLDPAATGLLVLCVGRAGRVQSFLTGFDKTYQGTMRFGVETDTYDREGKAVGEPHPDPRPPRPELLSAVSRFTGEFDQTPPPFSAKKVGGKKFYEFARKGEAIPELPPKKVRVARFDLMALDGDRADFLVECSSGTYIRSLVHDVGRTLAMGAHLIALRRLAVGAFRVDDSIGLPALEAELPEGRTRVKSWIPLSSIPLPYPSVALLPGEAAKVKRGHAVPVRPTAEATAAPWVRLMQNGDLVALGHLEPLGRGALALARPKIVLAE